MPRKENTQARGDRTSKTPTAVGDRGQKRPAARRTNAQEVDDAATRDENVHARR